MTVAFIPARMDSSRFPGKPLADIDGKPMIQRVYDSVCRNDNLRFVRVATHNAEIMKLGLPVIGTFGIYNNGTERVAHAARLTHLPDDEIVINVQGDLPIILPSILDDLMVQFDDPTVVVATVASNIKERDGANHNVVKVDVGKDGYANWFARDRISEHEHVGIYAFRNYFLQLISELQPTRDEEETDLEQMRIIDHGFSIKVVFTEHECPSVNVPADIEKVVKCIHA